MDALTEASAKAAMWVRAGAAPFSTRELAEAGEKAGAPSLGAYRLACAAVRDLKAHRAITWGGGSPRWGKWTLRPGFRLPNAAKATKASPPPAPPPPKEPVALPFDPDPAVEGPNNGLSEALADRIWRSARASRGMTDMQWCDQTDAIRTGWRAVARDVLAFMLDLGFTCPGGPPRHESGYSYAWVYEASEWVIYDRGGGCIALVSNDANVPLFLAAPLMVQTIHSLLTKLAGDPASDLPEIRALARSVSGVPIPGEAEAEIAFVLERGVSLDVFTKHLADDCGEPLYGVPGCAPLHGDHP